MRHGPAEDVAPSGQDFDRALTVPGRERVRRVADELVRRGEAPRRILASPLVRALQTAEIVAQACKAPEPVTVRREISPGGELELLVEELRRHGASRVMLVGHEPDMSSLVQALLPAGFGQPFEKAMVVGLRCRDRRFERRFVLEPRGLAWS